MTHLRTDNLDTIDPTKPTVAILGNSNNKLCKRWAAPFQERGYNVKIISPSYNINTKEALDGVSALFLPGGNSNIHPDFIGRDYDELPDLYDTARDFTAMALVKEAYAENLPTMGICRGMQEIIATFGGKIEKMEGDIHATNYQYKGDLEKMDLPVHPIKLIQDGIITPLFEQLVSADREMMVNSLHYEGITIKTWNDASSGRLQHHFNVEGISDDQVVEMIAAKHKDFFVGVQAHFELRGKLHDALFGEFYKHVENRHQHNQQAGLNSAPPSIGFDTPVV